MVGSGSRARRATWRAWRKLFEAARSPRFGQSASITCSRWRRWLGAKASSFTRLAAFLRCHAPSDTTHDPTQTSKPPKRRTRTGKGPSEERPLRVRSLATSVCIPLPLQQARLPPIFRRPPALVTVTAYAQKERPGITQMQYFLQVFGESLRTPSRRSSSHNSPSTSF
jgi:hypothetical protein